MTGERTERFQRALKDFKDLMARGGLAQDTTVKGNFETINVMMANITRIGQEDGMTKKEIVDALHECYTRPKSPAEMENVTLYDALGLILYDLKPDKQGVVDNEQIPTDFPHDKEFAARLVVIIHQKFMACTEEERRTITRSDTEFVYLISNAVAMRCGFKDMEDAFGMKASSLDIPKIKRGKELFWTPLGDPDPQEETVDETLKIKTHDLIEEIIANFNELYPGLYAKLKDNYSGSRMVLNTSHADEADEMHRLAQGSDLREFKAYAAPYLVDALVMSFLVEKKYYINNRKRRNIRKTLIESVLKEEISK